uniref:Uncharacterized protein n=1 Tax=Cacopsylla melanoneura TaxID=428564 RepID=A0A8D8S9B0_9HEMI
MNSTRSRVFKPMKLTIKKLNQEKPDEMQLCHLLLHPISYYLLVNLFHHSTCGGDNEDSKSVVWTELNVNNDEWPGLKNFSGRDLCANDQKGCEEFRKFVAVYKGFPEYSFKTRHSCETDANLAQKIVCWVRGKDYSSNTMSYKTTTEVQFWVEGPQNASRCRWATPSP